MSANSDQERSTLAGGESATPGTESSILGLFEHMAEGCAYCRMVFENGQAQDFIYLAVNPAFETLTGLKDVAGKWVSEAIPGIRESDPQVFALYARVVSTGKPEKAEFFVKALNMWFAVSVYRPKHECFVAIFDVVTERKRAENELRESTAKLEAALASMTDAVFVSDVSGNFIDFNEAFATFHRFRNKAECAKTFAEYPDILDVFMATGELAPVEMWAVPRALRGETVTNAEYGLRRKDTGETWVGSYSFGPIRDKAGAIVGSVVVGRDITEHKRAQQALQESATRLGAILDACPIPLALYDEHQRITFGNRAFIQTFGYQAEEIPTLAAWWQHAYPDPHYRQSIAAAWQAEGERAQRTGTPFLPMEVSLQCKDGSTKTVLASTASLSYASSREYLAVLYDITERKRAEEAQAKLEGQLQQSQKMESVGRLAGGVAHDFNNMLGVILGHTELALEEVGSFHPVYGDLKEIQKAGRRSAELTNRLLAFARKQTVAPKVLDLNHTVAGMLKMLQRLIGEDIDLAWLPHTSLWSVKADPSQIDQIMANLCVNARDAIANTGKITIETGNQVFDEDYCASHAGHVPGDFVRLAVSDDGCGMDKETQVHLFEPFFTTKPVGQGTGLGLATVYGIVKQNNGFLNVYSEPGHGTTFRIYLPRHVDAALAVEEGQEKPATRGSETILVVEDEPAILSLTKTMLQRLGYQVLAANTPGEAIRVAAQFSGQIHLLMTDVVMPEMNGRDLASKLSSTFPALKKLYMSGYTANVIAHHGVLDEGVLFIQKPFSKNDLARWIRTALDGPN
jgi:PAS domain S-box-containing protein